MKKQVYIYLLLLSTFTYSCGSNILNDNDKGFLVIKVDDGDSYKILDENNIVRIRIFGIDAPEKGMPFYKKAKKELSSLILNQNVKIKIIDKDKYGRLVAETFLNDSINIAEILLKKGLAWHYKKYSQSLRLDSLETNARINKLGLWIDPNPFAPWVIRRLHKNGISTKDSF